MKRIGIISDTHGTFDDTLREFLKDVDEIWHAGDIGSLELADTIASFKPLRAVSGNIDGGLTRRVYPDFLAFECEGVRVLMTHIGGYPRHYDPRAAVKIQALHPKLFIAGHSHILKVVYDPVYDLLHVNPGAAGEYGFHKVRTAVRLVIDGGRGVAAEIIRTGRQTSNRVHSGSPPGNKGIPIRCRAHPRMTAARHPDALYAMAPTGLAE